MKIKCRYLSLFISLLFLTLPAGAGPDAISGYGNFTGEPGWNVTQNTSQNYFYFDSNLVCVATGEVGGSEEEVYADGFVEDITFLTDSPESELFPVWTANGSYIMYMVQRDGSENSESYKMTANGSEVERTGIGEGNLTGFSEINPNGTELVITKSINSQPGLYIVSLENETDKTVSPVADDPDKSEGWGAWCRLGRKIVYTQQSWDSPSQLWIVDRDGSNKTRLGTSENVGMGKDWCPLGLKVLYSARNSKEKPDLWVIDWYGTNQTQLTDTPYGEWNPSFSPDGKRIVYVSDERGKPDIWLRDIEGNYRIRLTNNTGIVDSIPRWSPDGSKIVFTAHNLQNTTDNSTMNRSGPVLPDNSNNPVMTNSSNVSNLSTVENSTVGENPTTGESYPARGNNSAAGDNSPITNNSITNNSIISGSASISVSDYNPGNVSDNSIMNGSDIAVIQLENASAVSSLPEVISVKIDSAGEVSENRSVNISITVKNEGRNSSEGYVWVSFPDGGELEMVEGTGNNVKIYPKGSMIQGKNGEMPSQYPLVEFIEYGWNKEQEENLNITLIPSNEILDNETISNVTNNEMNNEMNSETISNGIEEITLFVRAALKNDLTGSYTIYPQFSEELDQQGLKVYRYSI